MSEHSQAPWNSSQVAALIRRQNREDLHPYTCANGHGKLSVSAEGFECLACDYQQTWAHAEDVVLWGLVASLPKEKYRVVETNDGWDIYDEDDHGVFS